MRSRARPVRRLLLLRRLLLVLCLLSGPAAGQGRVEVLVRKARKAEAAGDLPMAVAHLQDAYRLSPEDRDLARVLAVWHTRLGKACYENENKDLDGALFHFRAADRLTPDVEGILQSLGVLHAAKGDRLPARRCMRRVLELNPDNTTALAVLGNLARERDDTEKARDYYERAAAREPGRSDLKALADQLGRQAEVEQSFSTAVKGNFRVQYQGGREAGVERNINRVFGHLERARKELYTRLLQAPGRILTVVVYTDRQYEKVAVHSWARAYYDGKIRIALKPGTSLQQNMRADLRHELTHAFLFELFPKAPLWVHEGYAQLIEGRSARIAAGRFRNGRELLPERLFLGAFNRSPRREVVETGYAQSLMAVAWLQRSGTRRQFRNFLRLVGGGVPSGKALQQVYGFGVAGMLARAVGN